MKRSAAFSPTCGNYLMIFRRICPVVFLNIGFTFFALFFTRNQLAFDYIMGEWRVVALQLLIFFHAFKEGFTGEAYTQLQNYLLPFVFPCPKNSLPNFSRIEEQLASIAQKSCTLPWFNAIHRTLLLPILKALFAWTQSNYSMEGSVYFCL
jgi:hypothetical protein